MIERYSPRLIVVAGPNGTGKKVDDPDNEIVPCRQDIETDNQLLNQTEEVAEFKRLTDDLFGQGYYYFPEKTDQKILAEVLSEKYA